MHRYSLHVAYSHGQTIFDALSSDKSNVAFVDTFALQYMYLFRGWLGTEKKVRSFCCLIEEVTKLLSGRTKFDIAKCLNFHCQRSYWCDGGGVHKFKVLLL